MARLTIVLGVGAVALAFTAAGGQDPDPRLVTRLDSATRVVVQAVVDSVARTGLPTEPLYDRAMEGAMKGIPGPRIIVAVRTLAAQLGSARDALAPTSDPNEIKAGAMALQAGVSGADLSRVRRAAPTRRLTAMLTLLADLTARNVPEPSAVDVIASFAAGAVTDAELAIYQRDLHGDLASGADPRSAALTRARGLLAQRQSAGAPRTASH